jgi:CubicO group peptidase (beta-lactamase class C family)
MDKMFTAVAIAQLVETGRVDLDAAFGTYLSDYPNKSLASSVTLRQLLNHTGGTGDIFGPVFDANRAHLRTLADYVALYGARAGKFPAGARWDYSNYGYILLGRVIEAVTGQSYYDYLENHLFRPAGMTHTGFAPEDEKLPDRAVAYDGASDMSRRADDTLPYRGTSAGGGYSTAGDLLAFAEALEAGKIISPSTLKAFSTGTMETPMAERYGLGFTERIANGAQVIGHSGGAPGMNADFGILDGGRGVVIVLSNFSPPTAQEFADFIEERAPVD